MAPSTRSDAKLNLNLSDLPVQLEQHGSAAESPFNASKLLNGSSSGVNATRLGAGSPLLESGPRLFPRRTRELQGQTLSPSIWGPRTSGTSTPLQLIPESPSQDSFPDLIPLADQVHENSMIRLRAGTLPSRISPIGTLNATALASKTSRPTPSTSPFRPPSSSSDLPSRNESQADQATRLSRLRAGSLPQRSNGLVSSSLFGSSLFSSNWTPRDRAATLTSINSSEDPSSPNQLGFTNQGMTDTDVRTLDYLGLAETPQHVNPAAPFRPSGLLSQQSRLNGFSELMANVDARNSNRFRSFSVNAPRVFDADNEDTMANNYAKYPSGTLTPSAAAAIEAEYEAVQEKVRLHNLAVQDFAKNASAARPRARTAGIIETPQRSSYRNLARDSSPLENGQGVHPTDLDSDFLRSFQAVSMSHPYPATSSESFADEESQASRSLWIGNIPISTTTSSLDVIFGPFGPLESTRVLTHKNCGFVNFEQVEDAFRARQVLNGHEIFPGSGPVRIGFAKVPTASTSITPTQATRSSSPIKDGVGAQQAVPATLITQTISRSSAGAEDVSLKSRPSLGQKFRLHDLYPQLLDIVLSFGAQQSDVATISASMQRANDYQLLQTEIPSITEPSQARTYDAPRLRDIRKRIDNGAYSLQEMEQIAQDMLPEIAELASDYLGNTVVQKLFEFCSEQIKEQMLDHIGPHIAEIGVHKNGTWAAQKIIEVCKTERQIRIIVDNLRPYTVPLFLDQYGNYVLQCCLRFGPPYNDFIFETMLTQMLDIAHGRFGARAMRACLESHHSSKHQQRMLAAAIALNSVKLATNTNGALLLTWFLDTCTFPMRRTVLAPQLEPHLVELCTHKVAYLTVLKVINQRNEPEARDMILQALFFSPGDEVLEQILSDQTSGATLVFKILTAPIFDERVRSDVVANISMVLTRIKAQPNQGYKRLMDEVGMSARSLYTSGHTSQLHVHPFSSPQPRPMSQPTPSHPQHPPMPQRQYSGSFVSNPGLAALQNGQSPVRCGSADSYGYTPYAVNNFSTHPTFPSMFQMTPQQIQYPNFMTAPQRPNGTYMHANGANAFSGYATPPNSVDTYRAMQAHSSPLHNAAHISPMSGGYNGESYQQTFPATMYGYHQQGYFPTPMHSGHGAGSGRPRRR